METKTRTTKKAALNQRSSAVAEKLIKVKESTHRLLKIEAAKQGKSIGELLTTFAEKQ